MARSIQSDDELEQGKRGNRHAFDCHLINCWIGFSYLISAIAGILLIAFLVFVICAGYEYFVYLVQDENKTKLFELLEWLATHTIGIMVGATPFLVLWLRK